MGSTIAALATPHGTGALAIIRVSGPEAFSIVKESLDKRDLFSAAAPRTIALYLFVDRGSGAPVDHVSAVKYRGPRSYTGEDMVEIICHGGVAVVERILERLIDAGATYASRGEFTRRAFLNGKIDLAGAESIPQVVSSRTACEYRSAIESYFGGYRPLLEKWRHEAESLLVELESSIEFGEEDDVEAASVLERAQKRVESLRGEVAGELAKREQIRERQGGVQVAFVGAPNAGKSTLLNLVLGYERSIVFPEEGTTRDEVSEWLSWRGLDVKFVDCAGLRETDKPVEKVGVERSLAIVDSSDFLVLVTAADEPVYSLEREVLSRRRAKGGLLGVVNKIDLANGGEKERFFREAGIPHVCTSAIESAERAAVVDFLLGELERARGDIEEQSILCTKRQENIAKRILEELAELGDVGRSGEEIVALRARNVLALLDEFVGKTTTEDILNAIFEEFCIGK